MKLAELERHLRFHGCALYREGAAHSIWFNPASHKIASVPIRPRSRQRRRAERCLHHFVSHPGSRPRGDASLRPGKLHDDRSTRPM
jgi:hypothetical protein